MTISPVTRFAATKFAFWIAALGIGLSGSGAANAQFKAVSQFGFARCR